MLLARRGAVQNHFARRGYCAVRKPSAERLGAQVPSQADIVVIGGGVIGCGVAYHLAKFGASVLLLERSGLTHGCTWHAAGLVGQLRNNRNLTKLGRDSTALYRELEKETGQAVGWREVGSVRIASSPERMLELKRLYGMAQSFGFEMDLVSPKEAQKLCPVISLDNVEGAAWIPTDGYVDPTMLTMALANGARKHGAKLITGVEVTGFKKKKVGTEEFITHIIHSQGETEVNKVVNCAGLWANQLGKLMGAPVPTCNVQHQYMVSNQVEGVHPNLPTFRDPDHLVYLKPEHTGLVLGGWEANTIPVHVPTDFGTQLYDPNYDRFEQHIIGATKRVPRLADVAIKTLINGPIPVTADGEPILGRTPEISNAYVGAGFTAGVAASGGCSKALAQWIMNEEPPMDLWPLDIRRFGQHSSKSWFLMERSVEIYGDYYTLHPPFREHHSARDLRKSPLYESLKSNGGVFGSKFGWERPNWFTNDPNNNQDIPQFGYPNWWDAVGEEHAACRNSVVLFDQTSFAKLVVEGPDAYSLLQRLAANHIGEVGSITYTQMCNHKGGIECDLTIARIGEDKFYVVTGTGFGTRDFGWIKRNAGTSKVQFTELTGAYACINIQGPRSRDVLKRVTNALEDDMSNEAFPFFGCRNITIGSAPVWALRVTFVGELGYELHFPQEYAQHVYDLLRSAGQEFNIRDAGYRAINSLRCEKGYRFWGSDMTSDYNPYEAGLGFCVSLTEEKGDFVGRKALEKVSQEGPKRKLVCFILDKAPKPLTGGETIYHNGKVVGITSSADYGYTIGKHVAFGYLPSELCNEKSFEIASYGQKLPATRQAPLNRCLYDHERKKILA